MYKPWYEPKTGREALDCVEHISCITTFIKDSFSKSSPDVFTFSEDGDAGLYFILDFMQDKLRTCVEILAEEVA